MTELVPAVELSAGADVIRASDVEKARQQGHDINALLDAGEDISEILKEVRK